MSSSSLTAKEPSKEASGHTSPFSEPNEETVASTPAEHPSKEKKPSVLETSPVLLDNAAIQSKFEKELAADAEFHKELTDLLFSFILQFQAWSAARPLSQVYQQTVDVHQRLDQIEEREKAQEYVRQNFSNFLDMMRMALIVMGNDNPV